jgi:hypothetical protein
VDPLSKCEDPQHRQLFLSPSGPSSSPSYPSLSPEEENRQLQRFFQGIAKPHLPKFDGTREKLYDWRGQFQVFVESANVPVRHKMIMLSPPLADRQVSGGTPEQFELALSKLDQRYGGDRPALWRRQLQQYVDSLLAMSNVGDEDLEGLEDMPNYL